jgi:hypothetical protein
MRSHGSGPFDLTRLLDGLETVDYIVVGGVAGTLHGSPRLTFDLDIVPDPSEGNVERLAVALKQLGATLREPGNRRIALSKRILHESARVSVGGQLRLRTRFGPLDVLWRLHDGRGYAELLPHAVTLSDRERRVRTVDIDALIEIKKAAGRPQDVEDVRYLEYILRANK